MKIKVKFFAALREITGLKEENVELNDGSTIEDLLDYLSERFGPQFKNYVFDEKTDNPRSHLQFLLDGVNVASKNGLKTLLNNESQFVIVPPVGGG